MKPHPPSYMLTMSIIAAVPFAITACTSTAPTEVASARPDAATGCKTSSKVTESSDGLEIESTSTEGMTLYGLIQTAAYPFEASAEEKKIVWRATGAGDPTLSLYRPDGDKVDLAWGPAFHGSSNYDRPGGEYGVGFVTDSPGCWNLRFERSESGWADVWFEVVAREK